MIADSDQSISGSPDNRHLTLEGAHNLRDLGGYPTRFGRAVRWRRVYRGGELMRITDADVAALDGLGLRLIYDLRTTSERDTRPSRSWPDSPQRLHRDYAHSGADLSVLAAPPSAEELRERMIGSYSTMPFDFADSFRIILLAAGRGTLPLLFHCAGGKDRTGVFAALMQDLLGVAREHIFADYLLSNDGVAAARARFLAYVDRDDIDPAAWDPLLIVDNSYLQAMFDAVDARHGGTAGYFAWLDLSLADIDAIRDNLLEPA